MGEKRNLYGLDLMKFIAAMLVVSGHVRPLLSYSLELDVFVIHVLARVTIQFFFMTAGYLLFRKITFPIKDNKQNLTILYQYVKRILILYSVWFGIYTLVILVFFTNSVPFNLYGFYIFYKFLLAGSHLWYLLALGVGMVVTFFLLRRFSFKTVLILGALLYLVGVFGDAYYGVARDAGIAAPYDLYLSLFNTTRDGLFFGTFFVSAGAYFIKHDFRIRRPFIGYFIFLVAMTFEVFLLRAYSQPLNFNMMIFALPASVCLFSGMLEIQLKERKIYKWLRDGSLIVYLVHPLLMMVLPMLFASVGLGSLYRNSLVQFFAVASASYAFAWGLMTLTKKWPVLHLLY